jgi:hypothetical protein
MGSMQRLTPGHASREKSRCIGNDCNVARQVLQRGGDERIQRAKARLDAAGLAQESTSA